MELAPYQVLVLGRSCLPPVKDVKSVGSNFKTLGTNSLSLDLCICKMGVMVLNTLLDSGEGYVAFFFKAHSTVHMARVQ